VDVLNYEALVANFESKLLTQLRSFGADAEYLEMWVPDQDPVKSILNMVEAAESFGQREVAIRVAAKTLPANRVDVLVAEVGNLACVDVQPEDEGMLIVVTNIGTR
jgi:hypothetical protein